MNFLSKSQNQTAVFGAGCFWCTEAVFQSLRGVVSVIPGYAGGHVENPSYEAVCSGQTGHIEVAKIEFNPTEISYQTLLKVFFLVHDPTTQNRQGGDVGEQYASAIFYADEGQKAASEAAIAELEREKIFSGPIVTQIRPLEKFYEAEDYHHEYFKRNPQAPYCQAVINPKLAKMREHFSGLLK